MPTRPTDGPYKVHHAIEMARARRRKSRRGTTFSQARLRRVNELIRECYSPEQISG